MKYLYVNVDCVQAVNLDRLGFITFSNLKNYCDSRNLNLFMDDFGNMYIEPAVDFIKLCPEYIRVCKILKGGRYEKA